MTCSGETGNKSQRQADLTFNTYYRCSVFIVRNNHLDQYFQICQGQAIVRTYNPIVNVQSG